MLLLLLLGWRRCGGALPIPITILFAAAVVVCIAVDVVAVAVAVASHQGQIFAKATVIC